MRNYTDMKKVVSKIYSSVNYYFLLENVKRGF